MNRMVLAAVIAVVGIGLVSCGKKDDPTSQAKEEPRSAPAVPIELAAGAKKLQAADVSNIATTVKQNAVPAITPGDYIIDGEKRFNGWFLSAERIIFKPGAKLIFTRDAIAARTNFFVLAKEIVSESQESPGKITWERPTLSIPTDAGTAGAGADKGAKLKTAGDTGETGRQGNPGPVGADAPSLTIIATSIKASLLVDLGGQGGGQGGKGQNGGRGGGGGRGDNASQSLFDCKRGAENGYPGGSGGNGGKGGSSGNGGRGGTFTLITSEENMAAASRLLKVELSGGQPGTTGGLGGDGGAGGPGGAGGADARPYCQESGSQGPSGVNGQNGAMGDLGQHGASGDYFVGSLTPTAVTELLTKR